LAWDPFCLFGQGDHRVCAAGIVHVGNIVIFIVPRDRISAPYHLQTAAVSTQRTAASPHTDGCGAVTGNEDDLRCFVECKANGIRRTFCAVAGVAFDLYGAVSCPCQRRLQR